MKEVVYDPPAQPENMTNSEQIPGGVPVPAPPGDAVLLMEKEKSAKLDLFLSERALREEHKNALRERHSEEASHLGRIIFFLVLVLAFGIGVGAYALIGVSLPIPFLSPNATSTRPTPEDTPEIPKTQKNGTISLTNSPREQILVDISAIFNSTVTTIDGRRLIKFVVSDAENKTESEATAAVLLNALSANAPPRDLLRSLETKIIFGILGSRELSGYLELRSRSYPESFAGMLLWEPTMTESLIPAFHPNFKRSELAQLRDRPFKDERILGVNARVLNDPEGNSLLAYAFVKEKVLVIAGGRDALWILLSKLSAEEDK